LNQSDTPQDPLTSKRNQPTETLSAHYPGGR
jgi:hypothetical protein